MSGGRAAQPLPPGYEPDLLTSHKYCGIRKLQKAQYLRDTETALHVAHAEHVARGFSCKLVASQEGCWHVRGGLMRCWRSCLKSTLGRRIRRSRHQNVHMVLRHVALQNLDLVRPANLPDHFPETQGNLTAQNRFPILRGPHKVVLDVKTRMCGCTVVLHAKKCTLRCRLKARASLPPIEGQ